MEFLSLNPMSQEGQELALRPKRVQHCFAISKLREVSWWEKGKGGKSRQVGTQAAKWWFQAHVPWTWTWLQKEKSSQWKQWWLFAQAAKRTKSTLKPSSVSMGRGTVGPLVVKPTWQQSRITEPVPSIFLQFNNKTFICNLSGNLRN